MKAEVIKKFKDKYTGVLHEAGEVIEVTEERFEEILKVGKLIGAVAEDEKPDETAEPEEAETKPTKRTRKKTEVSE